MFDDFLLVSAVAVSLIWVHGLALVRRDARVLSVTLFFDLVVGVLVLAAAANTPLYKEWMQEDNWAEWGTFFAFLGAGIAAASALRLELATPDIPDNPIGRWLAVGAALGLTGFCFFVAGEEISWAQRLLAFKPPDIFLEKNFQQELNLHNLLKGEKLFGLKLDSKYLVIVIAVCYGLIAPAAIKLLRPKPWLSRLEIWVPPLCLAPWFGAVAVAEMTYKVDLTGEGAELVLGLVFLADGLLRLDSWGARQGRLGFKRVLLPLGLPLLLGMGAVPLSALLFYGSDEDTVALASRELERLRIDVVHEDTVDASLFRKSSIHKRIFTAVRTGYFHFGNHSAFLEHQVSPAETQGPVARRDRHGYFLDPWNNPYWIRYMRKRGVGVIYSFGPNRRRDTDLTRITQMSGDDIGVFFELKKPQ